MDTNVTSGWINSSFDILNQLTSNKPPARQEGLVALYSQWWKGTYGPKQTTHKQWWYIFFFWYILVPFLMHPEVR